MLETCPVRQYPNRKGGHLWLKQDMLDALHIQKGKKATVLAELKNGSIVLKKSEGLQHDDVIVKEGV